MTDLQNLQTAGTGFQPVTLVPLPCLSSRAKSRDQREAICLGRRSRMNRFALIPPVRGRRMPLRRDDKKRREVLLPHLPLFPFDSKGEGWGEGFPRRRNYFGFGLEQHVEN